MLLIAVGDLEKGKEYEFRVRAKNLAGLGEPSQPSETVIPKAKACKCFWYELLNLRLMLGNLFVKALTVCSMII